MRYVIISVSLPICNNVNESVCTHLKIRLVLHVIKLK